MKERARNELLRTIYNDRDVRKSNRYLVEQEESSKCRWYRCEEE